MSTVTVTLSFTIPSTILQDLITHWTDEKSQVGVIGATPVSATDTVITLSTAPTGSRIAQGETLLIDGDPMPVVSVDGAVVTVSRSPVPQIAAAAHASGALVYVLNHSSLWDIWYQESGKPWVLGNINSLASQDRSSTILPVSGAVTIS